MKKSLIAFLVFFVCGAYAATHLDTENRLWFSADVVKNAIVEHVPENKQQSVANLYQDLMDQTTGKISVDSLFKVCRKAGFNTYKYEGFTQCKSFIQKMLTDAETTQSVNLNGFCPGLDEKGNNPNKLSSITDKTRIGDFCSSTNIRMGQVIFKPGYNCSCMASVCNPGFEFQGGACVTRIADGNGDCLREAYPKTSENNYLEKCKSFCEKKYAGRACKYTSVVMSHSTGQCICNPNSTEVDAAYESMHQAKEKQINNLKYYEVCGDHKGKSGGTEVCVEGVFNWVNIGRLQASGLAEEYARVRYKDTVHCDTVNIRTSWNDDYVKCSSTKSKRYYEFQFDDVTESIDSAIQKALVLGICKIHNVSSGISKFSGGYAGSMKCDSTCTSEMTKTARIFGLNTTTFGNSCYFSGLSMTAAEAESKLAKIDGIDSYVFFHGIQIQGSPNVISQLRQYIKSTGKTVRTFDCIKNVDEIKNSLLAGDDDVMRCTLNGQPIDFVFDDFSESWLYVQEVGESKMQCIVSGGKFAGQECYGLTPELCTEANAKYLKQNPGASGFRWDGKECVSLDANEAQFYDGAIQVGTGAIALVDCVFGTKLGCVLVMVETAGLATEMTTGVAIENRAGEFLSVSTRCKKRDCAISTIQNAGHVLSVMGALDATSLDSVDKELARLVGYIEPEDLSGVSDGDWNAIVTQLGGDPNDTGGTALVWLNRIGLGAQFLSIGASGLRLTAQAITKLAGKGSRIGRTASTVARALDTTGDAARAANNASDAARAANNTADAANAASDAGRAANNTSDAAKTTNITTDATSTVNNTPDASRVTATTTDAARTTDAASDASRAANNASDAAKTTNITTDATSTVNNTTDASRVTATNTDTARTTDAASDASRAANNASDVTNATSTTSDVAQTINATTDATSTVNNTTDASRVTATTTDAARTTSRTTNTATDVVRSVTASKYATDADADLIAKLGGADVFDSAVDGWRRDWADTAFPKSKLTDSEWNKLNQSLEKYNMEFVQGYFRNRPNDMTLVEYTPDNIRSFLEGKDISNDAYGTLSSRPVSFKYIMDEAKTGREIFIDVGDAKEQVFQTFMRNNGLEYDRASKKVYNPSATPLQRAKGKLYTYGQTFDKTIDDFLYRNGGYPASWRRADLTDAEFDVLRTDLHSRGLLLDTDPEGFLRISRISNSATNAAKTTTRTTSAATDAGKTVNTKPTTPYIPHIEIVDSSGFKAGLEKFINKHYIDPNTGDKSYPIRGDLIGILNREMALEDGILFMDPHYVKDNSVFASELAKQATVLNKKKMITAPVYMEMIDDAEDVLSNFVRNLDNNGINRASIPFSSSGHTMLLVKEGKKYTILDQYGNKELKMWKNDSAKSAVRSKEKVVSALKKAGVKQDDIVLNDYEMCNNMNGTCSIYTNLSAMGALDVLDETGESLHDIVKYHNKTNTKAARWGGTNIEKLVLENSELLIEYAKKALKRF